MQHQVQQGDSSRTETARFEVILAAHGEAETAGFFENFRVGQRTLAHSAEVMRLPAPLRWLICTLGALRKRLRNAPGSPHNAWTRAQAAALSARLEALIGQTVPVRPAFASAEPSIEALLAEPCTAGQRIVLSMSPSDSRLSCGLICHALARQGNHDVRVLARLWDDPAFIDLNLAHVQCHVQSHVQTRCANEPQPAAPGVEKTALLLVLHGTLIRDAHGRPPTFHNGEAEKTQFAHALQQALAGQAESPWGTVMLAYLNHDVAGSWSQPAVPAALAALSERGFQSLSVFPCDFLVDGGEIAGSLRQALDSGPIDDVRLLPCLNDSPAFIDYLARRICRALDEASDDCHSRWRCAPCPGSAGGPGRARHDRI